MVVEIPEQIFIVRNFMADLMAKRPDFNLLPIGRYSGKKNGKNRKNKNSPPPTLHRFFFHRPYILLIFKLPEGLLVKVAVAVRWKWYFQFYMGILSSRNSTQMTFCSSRNTTYMAFCSYRNTTQMDVLVFCNY